MYIQRKYFRENDTWERGGEWRQTLPKEGLLSAILLRIYAKPVTGALKEVKKMRTIDYIDKIEIIGNGSEVIKSFIGATASGLQWFDQGVFCNDYWHQYATADTHTFLLLNFGRRFLDKEYALDLSKWDSVEIVLSNDASATYFGEDWQVSLLCFYLRDYSPASIKGYMRTEEWRKYTTVQDETKYFELPTANKIRRVFLQVEQPLDSTYHYNANYMDMTKIIDDIELSLKTGELRVFKGGLDDLIRENYFDYGKDAITQAFIYNTAGYGFNTGLGYVLGAAWGTGQMGSGALEVQALEGRRKDQFQLVKSYTADQVINALFRGMAPEGLAVFRFDYEDDPVTWLDPLSQKTVKLDIHTKDDSNAADGTVRVILDRVVFK